MHLSRLQGSTSFLPSLHSDTWSDEQGWDKLLFTDWHQSWCWEAGERAVVMSLAQVAQCNVPCLSLAHMLFLSQAEEHFLSWLSLGHSCGNLPPDLGLQLHSFMAHWEDPRLPSVSLGSRAGVCLAGHSSSHPFCARSISTGFCECVLLMCITFEHIYLINCLNSWLIWKLILVSRYSIHGKDLKTSTGSVPMLFLWIWF